ncbi:MAG: response regulator transcription factor [Acidobacteriota bacterium]
MGDIGLNKTNALAGEPHWRPFARSATRWTQGARLSEQLPSSCRRHKILVVDNDGAYLTELQMLLEQNGYEVWCAVSGRQALKHLELNGLPHLALVDYRLPGMSAIDLAAMISNRSDVPVILMSTRLADSSEIAAALERVAKDFVEKPIDPLILLARIERLLKRIGKLALAPQPRLRVDDWLQLELGRCVASAGGREVRLSALENKLLYLLLRHAGRALGVEYLSRQLWPSAEGFSVAPLRILIHRIRKKIELVPSKPRYLVTRRGVGYSFLPIFGAENCPSA